MAEHGQLGAYWISEHLSKPLAQSHFCSLTGLAASTQVLSSSRSQLLLEADISLGFVIFSFHISHQLQFWICEQARWSCRTMVTAAVLIKTHLTDKGDQSLTRVLISKILLLIFSLAQNLFFFLICEIFSLLD